MSETELSAEELRALFILMAEADEVSNVDLAERYGYTLTGRPRRRLNKLGLVDSRKQGRALAHTLTDRGWARAMAEIERDDLRLGTGAAAATCLALLRGLRRYLNRTGQSLAEVFQPDTVADTPAPEDDATAAPAPSSTAPAASQEPAAAMPPSPEEVEKRIRAAYFELAESPGRHVPLVRLRKLLADLPREDVDAALIRMNLQPDVFVDPQSNQKALTPEERAAAVRIGGQDSHLISIEVM
ncbi:hypothetical protein GCM10010106_29110 [Thermopolyspora flexuosa]|jgi:hypothetical protein|uniref:Uncharacterized protein n=1 Tax=Thermopolyspora flexuosa TaxID=103836 RepID=A0A543IS20_9ACTN|nr:hypothetical protein [Thermopolyspora flexuosa]PZN44701.1 MAG: hypothetical protein DIU60_10495 [Actinomycetota bacterium]TQM73380.1 hypothetical protein FHX40_0018 [Thermopolyspora flexuosa]GGM80622.1 hypothetical protein GCM10010106_29110 [Thermopolyspora flexuosa]